MSKSVIIISGDLAGLSACYLRMNGYDNSIFEMHNITGGVCTGWKRQGWTISIWPDSVGRTGRRYTYLCDVRSQCHTAYL